MALALATGLVVRVARGYRSAPSIDDFAYLPIARAGLDPALYPRDDVLHHFLVHAPVWSWALRIFEPTIGLWTGLWLLTLLLSAATAAAVWRLTRALGASGWLAPVALLIGFVGRVVGVGRGSFDGAFGDAFHVQWLALCLLLWSYDAFVRGRGIAAGVLLGLTAVAHPVVAVHGAFVLLVAALAERGPAVRRFGAAMVATALVAAPVALPLAVRLGRADAPAWPADRIIADGYLFRTPHEFTLQQTSPEAALLIALLTLAGAAGLVLLAGSGRNGPRRAFAGLLAGHAALVLAMAAVEPSGPLANLARGHLGPYLLHLSRTSPLLLGLAAIAAVAALDQRSSLRGRGGAAHELLWLALFVVLGTSLVLFVPWRPPLVALLAVCAVLWRVPALTARPAIPGALFGAMAVASAAWCVAHDRRQAPVDPAASELYAWARTTAAAALFVVPPGLQEFREYARRSVYVDFKLFPATTPSAVPEWRSRLELVAAPDRLARESSGWEAVPYWDRTYAARNTPSRVHELLRRTGADYLVWDRRGLDLPPYTAAASRPEPGLVTAFANDRFEVYRLSGSAVAAR